LEIPPPYYEVSGFGLTGFLEKRRVCGSSLFAGAVSRSESEWKSDGEKEIKQQLQQREDWKSLRA
jgi:hypothetical protein